MDEALELPSAAAQKPIDSVAEDNDQDGSDDEDGGLDWTKLLPAAMRPVIPKRGEKEFEPRAGGSDLQAHILDRSRAAMFETLKATRTTSSKSISYGIWHPSLARVKVTLSRGTHFSTMGHSASRPVAGAGGPNKMQKRLELLPEEAVYLIERGTMFCWKESDLQVNGVDGVPMTVQQAYSEMIGTEDLDLEKFQVYAYLKRLGYVVTRAKPPNEHYPLPAPFSSSKSTFTVLERVKMLFGGLLSGLLHAFNWVNWWRPHRLNSCFFGISDYGSLFRSMRFIRSGHSVPLRRDIPTEKSSPYQIFYNVYKPATPFKKSAPPAPDFQIVVINARTTPMPTLQELTDLFDARPEEPLPLPRKRNPVQQDGKLGTSNSPPPPAPVRSAPASSLRRFFAWVFPANKPPPTERMRVVNPFVALKTGKKMVVISVVDSGNVGFFRFSQGAFGEWPMA